MIGSRDPVDDIDEQMTEEEYDEIMKGTRESENNKKPIKRKILSWHMGKSKKYLEPIN